MYKRKNGNAERVSDAKPQVQAFFDRGIEEMQSAKASVGEWIWEGYLARRQMTLLTAMWKTGKTTFIAGLLAQMKAGGAYCGQKVRAGRALVISEEDSQLWLKRAETLDLKPQVRFLCKPFAGRPTVAEWDALLDHVVAMHQLEGLDLVVIDTLTSFTPYRGENHAANAIDFLTSLRRLTECGMSVLLKHHPRRHEAEFGAMARGTGALGAAIDIIMEMYRIGHFGDGDCRRLLFGLSRHDETPIRMLVELDTERGHYVRCADQIEDEFIGGWPVLRVVLEDATQKLTRIGVMQEWPSDFPKPSPVVLWRWLDRAVAEGLILRDGLGRKNRPFRYWLPGAEDRWIERGLYLEDLPDIDPPPADANETAKQLAEAGKVLYRRGRGKKIGPL